MDVIRLHAAEAAVLTGTRVGDAVTARRGAERLLWRGAGAVLVEAGTVGNLLPWPGGERLLPLLPVETVDTTGAGDACSAALAVCLGAGAALEDAAVAANAAAALATTRLGAQGALPHLDDVRELLSGDRFRTSRRAGERSVHGEAGYGRDS